MGEGGLRAAVRAGAGPVPLQCTLHVLWQVTRYAVLCERKRQTVTSTGKLVRVFAQLRRPKAQIIINNTVPQQGRPAQNLSQSRDRYDLNSVNWPIAHCGISVCNGSAVNDLCCCGMPFMGEIRLSSRVTYMIIAPTKCRTPIK